MKQTTRQIAVGGITAALYAVLTWVTGAIAYGPIQLRIAEALTMLPFLSPQSVIGVTVGCFLANVPSGAGIPDLLIGTVATLLGAVGTRFCGKHGKLWAAPLPPILANGILVGGVQAWYTGKLTLGSYLIFAGQIAVSEALVCYGLGIPLILFLRKIRHKRD